MSERAVPFLRHFGSGTVPDYKLSPARKVGRESPATDVAE